MIPDSLVMLMREAEQIVVLTGAGISAESGIPTFRQALTGLWAQYDPTELATPEAFRRNPQLVWDWYAWRREMVAAASPNPGHFALVEMEHHARQFRLITQNVDGLHARAGNNHIIELHGSLSRVCCEQHRHPADSWDDSAERPPRCRICDSLLRPDVVWFGEALPAKALEQAFAAARAAALFLTIGTSGLVQPAASLPLEAAQAGAILVEVNPEPTPLSSRMDYILPGPSGTILPALVRAVWPD